MTPCDPLSINGIQEVSGSIPLISTKRKGQASCLFFSFVRVLWNSHPCEAGRGALLESGETAEHKHNEYPAYLHLTEPSPIRWLFLFCKFTITSSCFQNKTI